MLIDLRRSAIMGIRRAGLYEPIQNDTAEPNSFSHFAFDR